MGWDDGDGKSVKAAKGTEGRERERESGAGDRNPSAHAGVLLRLLRPTAANANVRTTFRPKTRFRVE